MTTITIPADAGPVAKATPALLRKVLTASFRGNFVEWLITHPTAILPPSLRWSSSQRSPHPLHC